VLSRSVGARRSPSCSPSGSSCRPAPSSKAAMVSSSAAYAVLTLSDGRGAPRHVEAIVDQVRAVYTALHGAVLAREQTDRDEPIERASWVMLRHSQD
jgi:hypothetical protein